MAALIWDKTGERIIETGTDRGVLYRRAPGSVEYSMGYAWNGLTGVTESPSGAEPTALWADNIKYITLQSAEEFGFTIEAFSCPPEFYPCDGIVMPDTIPGISFGQQNREIFGFSYRSIVGNDVALYNYGYKIHLIYGCLTAPSEKAYVTVNDSPDAINFSWEVSTTPEAVTVLPNIKPTALVTIESVGLDPTKLAALEKVLYGDTSTEPRLPSVDEVITMLQAGG